MQHLINTKTFDQKGIDDTTEIKIPIYDVYIALFNNGVIDLEQLRGEDASELEKKFFQIFLKKKSEVEMCIRDRESSGRPVKGKTSFLKAVKKRQKKW